MEELSFVKEEISPRVWRFYYLDARGQPLTFRDVVNGWADEDGGWSLRAFHCQVLSSLSFKAYRWETPVVDLTRFDRVFEFVVLDAPELDWSQDPSAFRKHFRDAGENQVVVEFENLGRNATLVVPVPGGDHVNHCHLASFLGTCTAEQESQLWFHVGKAMLKRVSDVPVWLSTAGGGVAWLHVRLDNMPKYYAHKPYRAV